VPFRIYWFFRPVRFTCPKMPRTQSTGRGVWRTMRRLNGVVRRDIKRKTKFGCAHCTWRRKTLICEPNWSRHGRSSHRYGTWSENADWQWRSRVKAFACPYKETHPCTLHFKPSTPLYTNSSSNVSIFSRGRFPRRLNCDLPFLMTGVTLRPLLTTHWQLHCTDTRLSHYKQTRSLFDAFGRDRAKHNKLGADCHYVKVQGSTLMKNWTQLFFFSNFVANLASNATAIRCTDTFMPKYSAKCGTWHGGL